MCLFDESLPVSRVPTCDDLLYRFFPLVPGVIVRLDRGANLLLVGCGEGEILRHLSGMFPRSRFAGLDPSDAAITCARQSLHHAGRQNVSLQAGDLNNQRFGPIFHVVVSLVPDIALPAGGFAALHRALKDDGILFLRHDPGFATSPLHDAGFSLVRHIVLPDEALSHVYVARK